jgi:heme exporter protein D
MANVLWSIAMMFCIFLNINILIINYYNPFIWFALSICVISLILNLITIYKKIMEDNL